MRNHELVNVGLTLLRPLAVVLPNNNFGVSEHIGDLLEARAVLQQSCGESMAITMGMGVLDARFFEYGR